MTGTTRNTRGRGDSGRGGNARPEPVPALDDDEAGAPYDLLSEKVVLGVMLTRPQTIDVVSDRLTSESFYNPKHALIYATITAAHALGADTGPHAIGIQLNDAGELAKLGGASFLADVTSHGETAGKLDWYIGRLADKEQQRKGLVGTTRLAAAIRSGDPARIAAALDAVHKTLVDTPAANAPGVKPLDWAELWKRDFDDIDWLIEPLIERGQSISLVGAAKAGKSLLTLECAAALATGRPVLGNPPSPPMRVLYVDQENTEQDVYRRLSAMGYRPEDLGNLVYLSFANLPPLNTAEGAAALLRQVDQHQAEIVILDTISRMVVGKENESDTWLDLYRSTLVQLKARRISVIRLDHHGKDSDRGARGSSAKQGDIDAEWELTATSEQRLKLRRTLARGSNGDGQIELLRHQSPLLHHEAVGVAQATAADIDNAIAYLDDENAPLDISKRKAAELLRKNGVKMSNNKILEAIQIRRKRPEKWSAQDQDHLSGTTPEIGGPQDQDHSSVSPAQSGPGPLADHRDHSPPSTGGGWSPEVVPTSGDQPAPLQDQDDDGAWLNQWPTVPPPAGGRANINPQPGAWGISGRPINRKEAS